MNNLVPHREFQPASQPLVLEGRDSPLRAELKSPVMKEGSRPDHNTNPHFLLTKAPTNAGRRAGCQLDRENGQQLDFALFYLKFLSIPMERIKCERRRRLSTSVGETGHISLSRDGPWPRGPAHKGAL